MILNKKSYLMIVALSLISSTAWAQEACRSGDKACEGRAKIAKASGTRLDLGLSSVTAKAGSSDEVEHSVMGGAEFRYMSPHNHYSGPVDGLNQVDLSVAGGKMGGSETVKVGGRFSSLRLGGVGGTVGYDYDQDSSYADHKLLGGITGATPDLSARGALQVGWLRTKAADLGNVASDHFAIQASGVRELGKFVDLSASVLYATPGSEAVLQNRETVVTPIYEDQQRVDHLGNVYYERVHIGDEEAEVRPEIVQKPGAIFSGSAGLTAKIGQAVRVDLSGIYQGNKADRITRSLVDGDTSSPLSASRVRGQVKVSVKAF